ncbi:hypothetical protein [Streptomyces violascens]
MRRTHGARISKHEVAEFAAQSGGRLRGVAGADLVHPAEAGGSRS